MKSTKRFFSVLVLFLAVAMFAGCGTTEFPNFEVPEGGYDGSAVTITFWHTMNADVLQPVLDDAIDAFKEIYPNITVEHSQIGGYDDVRDQIKTALTEQNQPNIAYCYPDHVALYNKSRAVVELDDLIASTIADTSARNNGGAADAVIGLTEAQIEDFIEGYYNEGTQFGNEHMYTLPFSKSTEVLYYDKTFFHDNNITVPTTWDDMEKVCAQIKEIDENSTPLGYDSSANWFITMCEQYGSPYTSASGDHFVFDNAKNQEFVLKFAEWYQKGYVTTQDLYGSYTSGLFINQVTNDNKTRSYMSIGSSAGASHQVPAKISAPEGEVYPFEVGIAPIPQVDADNPKVISQGPSVCIFKDSNPQEVMASWLFVKYLTTSKEFQAAFALASGYVPVIKSVAEVEDYKEALDAARATLTTQNKANNDLATSISALVCMEQEEAYYTSPAFIGSSTARDEVNNLMNKVFSASVVGGTAVSADALKEAIRQAFIDAIEECEYQL